MSILAEGKQGLDRFTKGAGMCRTAFLIALILLGGVVEAQEVSPQAIEKLITQLGDNDYTQRQAAENVLVDIGHPAIGALKATQAAGCRVPGHVSLVGMDDIYAAVTTSPALTTVRKPKYEIGVQAGQFLLERMAGEEPDRVRHISLPCVLEIRESTAPPRARTD